MMWREHQEEKVMVLLSFYVVYFWIITLHEKVKTFKTETIMKDIRKISLIWNLISAWILESVSKSEGGAKVLT